MLFFPLRYSVSLSSTRVDGSLRVTLVLGRTRLTKLPRRIWKEVPNKHKCYLWLTLVMEFEDLAYLG